VAELLSGLGECGGRSHFHGDHATACRCLHRWTGFDVSGRIGLGCYGDLPLTLRFFVFCSIASTGASSATNRSSPLAPTRSSFPLHVLPPASLSRRPVSAFERPARNFLTDPFGCPSNAAPSPSPSPPPLPTRITRYTPLSPHDRAPSTLDHTIWAVSIYTSRSSVIEHEQSRRSCFAGLSRTTVN
jgi:hypothetical protein